MKNKIIYHIVFFSILTILQSRVFATEIIENIMKINAFDSKVVNFFPVEDQEINSQLETFVLHIDLKNLKDIRFLQTPSYEIDFSGEDITLETLNNLSKIHSQIFGLNLMETNLKNDFFPIIQKLTSIKSLILSDNPFDDTAMPFIDYLRQLNNLEIVHTKITDVGLKSLLNLKNLEKLDAGCNNLKNEGIKNISLIHSLVDVDVRACGFDEKVLPVFFDLPNLKKLNISNNNFEKNILKSFLLKAKEKGIEVRADEIY
jgi:hypothetical protein